MLSLLAKIKSSLLPPTVALSKKIDDLGIEETNSWIKSYSINAEIKNLDYIEIKKYALKIIRDLNKVPVNSSNEDLIKNHEPIPNKLTTS